ncbi:MAG: hypothetical protein L3J43_04935 [Sulfurovum sp.]|nr:hypothetical protein [Sulfurovum sp.]
MIWNFIEDIAIFSDGSFVLINKVKLVEFKEDISQGYDTDLTQIYTSGVFDVQSIARIMTQLGEDIREYVFNEFQIYRHCEVCNVLFLKKSKNKWICSGKCKTRKYRI